MEAILQIKQTISALESGQGIETVQELNGLVSDFSAQLGPQDNAGTIVKMMQSIIKYLISKKKDFHPDSIALLVTLGSDLESIANLPSGNSPEARQILDRSILEFKTLKTAISGALPVSKAEFEELKAVILSVDWEITNLTLESFDKVICDLKEKVKSNKVHFTFLRIMHSIGGYIARNGANADNDSIVLLQSVFQNYEQLFENPGMPPGRKEKIGSGGNQKIQRI